MDVAVVKAPAQFTSRLSSSLGKQLQFAGLHQGTDGDEENPEFKLPKMSSLAMVITTNVLMQVISCILPAQWALF